LALLLKAKTRRDPRLRHAADGIFREHGSARRAITANPSKRIGQPEEVTAEILGLATTVTFVNGAVVIADNLKG
jgi:NAD(P)-dependent dehydrogenase (short-subunit alcohol dehydrogenase family)